MGSFSWLKADTLTRVANVVYGAPFKFLIPAEFGGGFIKEKYQDYGNLGIKDNGEVKYDMYELLAFWNANEKLLDKLNWQGKEEGAPPPMMKERDMYTDDNRSIGIQIGCYDNQISKLKYPLKLVSASYKGTYEDCGGRSYSDPNQGFGPIYRKKRETNKKCENCAHWGFETMADVGACNCCENFSFYKPYLIDEAAQDVTASENT